MSEPLRIKGIGSANRRPLSRQSFLRLRDGRFIDITWGRYDRIVRAFAARRIQKGS